MSEDMMDVEKSTDLPWEKKAWGSVIHVFNSSVVAVSVLQVKAGFRCSRHYHEHRTNRFCIVSGKIEIWQWRDQDHAVGLPNDPEVVVELSGDGAFKSIAVPAGIPHLFKVIEDGMVVEIYTPDGGPVSIDDIVRFDEGGPCD